MRIISVMTEPRYRVGWDDLGDTDDATDARYEAVVRAVELGPM